MGDTTLRTTKTRFDSTFRIPVSCNAVRSPLLFLLGVLLVGCGHATSVRPTPKDVIQAEASVGGPLVRLSGLTVPVPLSTAGVRYGLGDSYDVAAHLHLTSLSFGVAGLDIGSTWMPVPQNGALPALSLSSRLYGFSNVRNGPRAYLELTGSASYLAGEHFLTYLSATGLVQFAGGSPLLSVSAGEELRFGRFGAQLELRWYEPNIATGYQVVDWVSLGGQGGLGVVLGFNYRFSG
jgi:hypothetical protein